MDKVFQEPVAYFLLIMSVILVTPILSKRIHLPGIIGIILGGILIGPYGFKIVDIGDRITFLSTIGLVYLMFCVGLDVNLHQFLHVGGRSIVFGFLTFIFPQLLGMGLGIILGYNLLAMILLGSAFASHTLLAFPILMQLKKTKNEAVTIAAGATVFTDIAAFLVLAIILALKSNHFDTLYFIRLFIFLLLFTLIIVFGLPRFGKFFFKRFSGETVEFQFVIVVLFLAALVAKLIGVHEVVGAFLAGLSINAILAHKSKVSNHLKFIGQSIFIPIFLLYSGMMTNPLTFITSNKTVIIALGVIFVAYVSKLLAALSLGKIYHYTKSEIWTVYGLTHAQAAVTIPTLILGLQVGLFDELLFNAAIFMILLTSLTSPLLVQKFAPRIKNR